MLNIPKIPIKKSINIVGKGTNKKSSLPELKPKRKKYALPGEEGRNVGVAKSKIERAPTVLKPRSQADAIVSEHISAGRLAKTLAQLKERKREVEKKKDDSSRVKSVEVKEKKKDSKDLLKKEEGESSKTKNKQKEDGDEVVDMAID